MSDTSLPAGDSEKGAKSSPSQPPRTRIFRISLRAFLLAFTLAAIGFPIWYRWPYTEETPFYHRIRLPDGSHVADERSPPWQKIVTTWRRNWGRERTKHGPEMHCDGEGNIKRVFEIYDEYPLDWESDDIVSDTPPLVPGVAIMRFPPRDIDDCPAVIGKYVNRKATGKWVWEHPGEYRIVQHWENGLLHGPSQIERSGKLIMALNFAAGHLLDANGQSIPSELFDDLRAGRIDPAMEAELSRPRSLDYIRMPLTEAAHRLVEDRRNINLLIDSRHCNPQLPVTQSICGADLASALVLLIRPYHLDCDYRYGCLWVTSAAEARRTRSFDLTERLNQSNEAASVRDILAQITATEFYDTPLSDATQILHERHGIPFLIDHKSVDGALPIKFYVRDVTLQSALFAMCDLYNLDCDYRYGALWVTARNAGALWSDPTGIDSLTPPQGSPLEAAWNEDVFNEQDTEEPLVSFVTRLSRERGVNVDIYRIGGVERLQISTGWKNLPLRHVLGVFLYQNDLCCRVEADQLVLFAPAN